MPAKANTESSAGTLLQPEAASFEEPPRFGEYDGFLSYSHEDEALVANLQARLERFGRPVRRARSLRLFRDATNLPMTLDLWPAISRRIDASSSLILIASPNSAGKPWPAKEALHFLQRDGVSATRFGIILIQGSLPWVDGPTAMTRADCAIHADLYARLTALGVEPLVIDLRRFVNRGRLYLQWDRKYQMLLARIAAAILDRDPDELYGAHLRYRRIVFGLAIAALALIVGGIVWAMEATSEGMHRRAEAMFEKGRRALSEGDPIAAEAWMTAAVQVHDTPDRRLALADARLLGYRRIWVVPTENMDGSRLAIDPERRQVVVWTAHETRVLEADSGRESWRTAYGGSDVALLGPRRLLAVDGHQALLISHGDDEDIETIALPDDCGTYRGLVVDAARELAVIGSTTGCLAFLRFTQPAELHVRRLGMGDNAVTSMAFAPDGKQLAVGTQWREFGAILVVPITGDTAQRDEELMPDRVEGFPNPTDAVGYTFDGVMVGASTQLIRIQRGEAIRQFERRGSGPLLIERDSRFIVELDGADVTIRDLDETVLERIPRIGSASSVVSLGRGAGLVFAFRDRVEAWRPIAPVSRIKESCRDLQIYEDRVVTVQNAFSSAPQIVGAEIFSGRSWRLDVVSGDPPGDVLLSRGDRDLLVSRSLRGNLDIWRILARQKIHISALKRIETAAFSPTGNPVAVADKMRVAIVDVDSGAVRNLDNRQGVTKLSISDDGNRLAIGHRGGALEVLEIGTGKRIARDPTRSAVAHGGDTIDLKWLPGGEALLVEEFSMDGMEPRLLRMLWDLRSNKIAWESIDVERERRTGATLDPRGDFFVSLVGENQCLTLVHIDGRVTCIYAAKDEQVTAVAISPVESIVAYGRSDGIVELYDVRIGGAPRVIDSDGAAITALKFADGNVLAIGRQDGTVSVIGYNAGSRVLRASGPGPVQHLQFDAGAEMLGAIYITGEECQIRKLPVKGVDLPLYSEPDVLLKDSHSRTGLTLDNDVLVNTDSAGR